MQLEGGGKTFYRGGATGEIAPLSPRVATPLTSKRPTQPPLSYFLVYQEYDYFYRSSLQFCHPPMATLFEMLRNVIGYNVLIHAQITNM